MKKGCIVLNGEAKDYSVIKRIIENNKYDYIICSDGGSNHLYNMGICPHYIIGDLDSIKEDVLEFYRKSNVRFEKFPSKKNETDTELCIYLANKLNIKSLDFICALGGRIDHLIANINLLDYVKSMKMNPRILSENEEISIAINEEVYINSKKGDIISIIPINKDARGVTLTGLEYPLYNYDMKFGVPLGISNVMKANTCKVSVEEGSLLIIINK